jgi:hypothetical protein
VCYGVARILSPPTKLGYAVCRYLYSLYSFSMDHPSVKVSLLAVGIFLFPKRPHPQAIRCRCFVRPTFGGNGGGPQ